MPRSRPESFQKCCLPSCPKTAVSRGYCTKHYAQFVRKHVLEERVPQFTVTAGLMWKVMDRTIDPKTVEEPLNPDHVRMLYAALELVTPKERRVLAMRYGLYDDYSYTLEEVGRELRVTRERARQLETKALKSLQRVMDILLRHAGEEGLRPE